ncbi:flagellar basal-body rod protein FlgG [Acidovorax sp. Leaf84]|uniref:flagellar basal-body rod protein FlgG n=1 Tax=Acidovorax sp. Leaf84 TaxID=1736240 RepID=UPI0006F8D796|nr:flagellar basal-body rod protein FlgG [Acidovorax sp. Leaf84]KQO35419.1 flagellar basal-body rod protein FlgG [Acidovorax sp. Leaf84]
MFDALYIGATGMQAQQLNVDTIANNLANVNTAGFKRARVSFTDLVARDLTMTTAANRSEESGVLGRGLSLGAGVGVANLSKLFEMGDLKKTDAPYDVTIRGDGFLEVLLPDGTSAFTRGGTLKINKDGLLATQSDVPLKPGITIPEDTQELIVHADGRVQVRTSVQGAALDVGRIELVKFVSPQGLVPQGDNLYRTSAASGEAISARAGEDGVGTLAQGFLEGSNVKMVDEMVNLIVAQRTYEANVKIVQAADEILGMVNGLRR